MVYPTIDMTIARLKDRFPFNYIASRASVAEKVMQLTYLNLNSHMTGEVMSSMSKITPFRSDKRGRFASASLYKDMIKI